MAERQRRPRFVPLSAREPDEVIRVVRALKEMGASVVQIGDVRVRFDPFEPPTQDHKELIEEAAKDKAAQTRDLDELWSA